MHVMMFPLLFPIMHLSAALIETDSTNELGKGAWVNWCEPVGSVWNVLSMQTVGGCVRIVKLHLLPHGPLSRSCM